MKHENQLEKIFEKDIARKQSAIQIVVNNFEKDTVSNYVGYDRENRIINKNGEFFYEYDTDGKLLKKYHCILSRDPTCSKPYIYLYEYSDEKLIKIKLINSFSNDTIPIVYKTFIYDCKDRLIQQTQLSGDTIVYIYLGNDTCKYVEIKTSWITNAKQKIVKNVKKTTYQYDSKGRLKSLVWTYPDIGMAHRKIFVYDIKNRLIMEKDSSLDKLNQKPNSCCIMYLTTFKYDSLDRLIMKEDFSTSFDNAKPELKQTVIYKY